MPNIKVEMELKKHARHANVIVQIKCFVWLSKCQRSNWLRFISNCVELLNLKRCRLESQRKIFDERLCHTNMFEISIHSTILLCAKQVLERDVLNVRTYPNNCFVVAQCSPVRRQWCVWWHCEFIQSFYITACVPAAVATVGHLNFDCRAALQMHTHRICLLKANNLLLLALNGSYRDYEKHLSAQWRRNWLWSFRKYIKMIEKRNVHQVYYVGRWCYAVELRHLVYFLFCVTQMKTQNMNNQFKIHCERMKIHFCIEMHIACSGELCSRQMYRAATATVVSRSGKRRAHKRSCEYVGDMVTHTNCPYPNLNCCFM